MAEEKKDPQTANENAEGPVNEEKIQQESNLDVKEESQQESLTPEEIQDELEMKAEEPALGQAALTNEETPKRGGNQLWIGVSLLLLVLLVIALVKNPFAKDDSKTVVATVNGVDITKAKFYDELVKAGGKQTLATMIDEELVNQEATKAKVEVTDADIKATKALYLKQFGTEEALEQAVQQQTGMTPEQFKEQLEKETRLRKILEPKVKVTDDEIKQFFDANKATMNTEESARISSILVSTQAEAEEIVKQLKGGSDFATLAKEKSIDENTKGNGGDMGFITRGTQDEALEAAAFKLKKGEVSPVVKTSVGYQVLKMTDYKEAHTATLDEKKDEIKQMIVNQKVYEMSGTWLEELKSKAKINNTLENNTSTEEKAAK